MDTLNELARRLAARDVSARELVEQALDRISNAGSEGAATFIEVAAESARKQANDIDRRRAAGDNLPAFAGIPLAIKDLFDVAGEITRAGSRILADRAPAKADAPVVARLRAAGFIFIGRSNMTEFAYSGLGLNPHYGTPRNPFDRTTGRIPGGSTSGGAVAVADGMAAAALGTDTGGSCRIPAAFTGIVGFKPTAQRVPREGLVPLSPTLDSIGPLARSVQCCAILDSILRDAPLCIPSAGAPRNIRLLVPSTLVMSEMDEITAQSFARALEQLTKAGVTIVEQPLEALARIPALNANGGIVAAETYAWHRAYIESHPDRYDPRVATRILKGRDIGAQDLHRIHEERTAIIAAANDVTRDFDALLMPTVPIIAPPLSAFDKDADYNRLNALVLRNPSLANLLDRCSISLPIHRPNDAPVGLMLIGSHDGDEQLFSVALAIERVLERYRQ